MRRDLLEDLVAEARSMMESIRERESGYPKTRQRIENFIAGLPETERESVREMLLPGPVGEMCAAGAAGAAGAEEPRQDSELPEEEGETMATAAEIRKDSIDMVRGLEITGPTDKSDYLLEQSKVVALQEIAAQLAELNETVNISAESTLTLRDQFAMAALPALAYAHQFDLDEVETGSATAARLSYKMADAMLEARKQVAAGERAGEEVWSRWRKS